ncbi:helix-turn-helix domain-containing protein [Streptomyces sp. H27-D2]|uniref:helix-turn-helix domain-containing protein n=1 Tax=Streptomyces sp. H27-D2 TaxID=3046304 RepID=UPI002DBBD058|nr:helix-turn-helix domain-containing protein [Streptomyces sp. H27-D2]MEC4016087.1 helix-turn-helix domain-containing protein [Streptomyces sp. H27-D2]
MNAGKPIADEERARIRKLHAAGQGRNEIARELNRPVGTISNLAKAMGLSFDKSATAAATAVRKADLAAMRTASAITLHEIGDRLLQQVFEPHTVWSFGGKDNVYNDEPHPQPPAPDKKALIQAAATAFDRSMKMSPPTEGTALDDARSMLGDLGTALKQLAETDDGAMTDGDEA